MTALFGHRPRLKSAQQVIVELDRMYDEGWRSDIFFVDDNVDGTTNLNPKMGLDQLMNGYIAGSLSMVSLFVSYSTALKNATGAQQSIRNRTD